MRITLVTLRLLATLSLVSAACGVVINHKLGCKGGGTHPEGRPGKCQGTYCDADVQGKYHVEVCGRCGGESDWVEKTFRDGLCQLHAEEYDRKEAALLKKSPGFWCIWPWG
ncbi:hypothetical protein PCANC_14523 [Puccinia coronata f. sp. avenae]|uniref:Secreted protein n=1 Tax=Puccinia coronata f. sp. avenae TaxID=200324 RepID=A0A2N5SQJ9_9BASI|nr:hypothetical protein PCANC_14523 [Puccinia coronata f. sp. avenae]